MLQTLLVNFWRDFLISPENLCMKVLGGVVSYKDPIFPIIEGENSREFSQSDDFEVINLINQGMFSTLMTFVL